MTDFLTRLGERASGTSPAVVPVVTPLFARGRGAGTGAMLHATEDGDAVPGFEVAASVGAGASSRSRDAHTDDGRSVPPPGSRMTHQPAVRTGSLAPVVDRAIDTGPRAPEHIPSRDPIVSADRSHAVRDSRGLPGDPPPQVRGVQPARERDAGMGPAPAWDAGAMRAGTGEHSAGAETHVALPETDARAGADARGLHHDSMRQAGDAEREMERVLGRLRALGAAAGVPREGALSTQAPPVVRISIGRIEVRAAPSPSPAAAAQPRPQAAPRDTGPTLAEFLAKRPRVTP